jgi:hypothetical protein
LTRPKGEDSIIDQYGGIPLAEFELQVAFDNTLAGKTPPAGDLLRRKPLLLFPVNSRLSLQYMDAAAPAPALAATGKFNSLVEQQVAQRRSGRRSELDTRGPENNPMGLVRSQGLSIHLPSVAASSPRHIADLWPD